MIAPKELAGGANCKCKVVAAPAAKVCGNASVTLSPADTVPDGPLACPLRLTAVTVTEEPLTLVTVIGVVFDAPAFAFGTLIGLGFTSMELLTPAPFITTVVGDPPAL